MPQYTRDDTQNRPRLRKSAARDVCIALRHPRNTARRSA